MSNKYSFYSQNPQEKERAKSTDLKRRRYLASSLGLLLPFSSFAQGKNVVGKTALGYPNKAVRLVLPFPSGSAMDLMARLIAEPLSQRLGQAVFIDNRPGASGILAVNHVLKSTPDGYTLLLTLPNAITSNLFLFKKLPYDPRTEMRLITDVAVINAFLVINSQIPVQNIRGLIDLMRESPNRYSMGSWGAGSQPHQIQAIFEKNYGVKLLHVPYKSSQEMMLDVLNGQVSMSAITAKEVEAYPDKLRAIAVLGPRRHKSFPHISTFEEQGFLEPQFKLEAPAVIAAPIHTPDEIIDYLNKELVASILEVKTKIESMLGANVVANTAQESANAYQTYLPMLLDAVKNTGIEPN